MRRLILVLAALALIACSPTGTDPSEASGLSLAITSHVSGERVPSKSIRVSGTAPAGVRVVRDIALALDEEVVAGSDGRWEIDVELDEGRNELTFRVGDDSSTAITLSVTFEPQSAVASPPTATRVPLEPSFGPTGPTEVARVSRVVDGDTIRVEIDGVEYPVRYIGIDSPETRDPNSPIEWMGPEASEANADLVEGRTVVLETDVSERDQFDRLLRYVWLEETETWTLVNQELVRRGFASAVTYPPDVKYQDLFLAAEREARDAIAGLWAAPPAPDPTPTPTPEPEPAQFVIHDPMFVDLDHRERFNGAAGLYRWQDVSFEDDRATLRWSISAPSNKNCRLAWRVEPGSRDPAYGTIRVDAGEGANSRKRFRTPFSSAAFQVSSTCKSWKLSLQGYEPPPPPPPPPSTGGSSGGSSCHPSYRGACLEQNAGDYDCSNGSGNGPNYVGTVSVVGYDEFGLDADGDGIGCENG